MRFRTVVIAALVLVLASVAGLAAYQMADQSRGEAAQTIVTTEDSLAVDSGVRQFLAPEDGDEPTQYGANGTETVEYNGTTWEPAGNYTYYPDEGEIEFLRDEPGEANITYEYEIPENQVADEQLQTATEGIGNTGLLIVAAAFVVLLLFLGAFEASKMGVGQRQTRGR